MKDEGQQTIQYGPAPWGISGALPSVSAARRPCGDTFFDMPAPAEADEPWQHLNESAIRRVLPGVELNDVHRNGYRFFRDGTFLAPQILQVAQTAVGYVIMQGKLNAACGSADRARKR